MTTDFCTVDNGAHQCLMPRGHVGKCRCWHGIITPAVLARLAS